MLDRPMIEARSLEFIADESGAKQARNFVIIENIGVDGVDRHRRATRLQHHKVA